MASEWDFVSQGLSQSARQRPLIDDYDAFHEVLRGSKRIMALCGAGLSAGSGLPTFRGAGGLWRNHKSTQLATPEAFERDPGLVWLFYAYRRHMALKAEPNDGHRALAELARRMGRDGFLNVTQNVDGLDLRVGHPQESLRMLHGSLFNIKCSNPACNYFEPYNVDDPLCPALAPASEDVPADQTLPLLDPNQELAAISPDELPHCPTCSTGLLRPGVVWFGESLDDRMMQEIDEWMDAGEEAEDEEGEEEDGNESGIDLMLVVGTGADLAVPAAYIEEARGRGARVVLVNLREVVMSNLGEDLLVGGDFAFMGDAAETLPRMLEPIIGKL